MNRQEVTRVSHSVFVIGTVFVVAVQVVSIILFYNPAWKTFAGGGIAAWGKFAL